MDWLLFDTDVISYTIKNDTRAQFYEHLLENHICCISFMTLAELEFWAIKGGWGVQRMQNYRDQLSELVVLDSNQQMASLWAELTVAVEKQGRHIACGDAWNAATALYYNLPLVTHNYKDYASVPNLQLISMNKK